MVAVRRASMDPVRGSRHRRGVAALLAAAVVLTGCVSSGPEPAAPTDPPAAAAVPEPSPSPPDPARTLWLCHPGQPGDACDVPLESVTVTSTGSTPAPATAASPDAAIDCFYLYPTVSTSPQRYAPLEVTPELERAVRAQAVRFGSVCRLFAPVYRQLTLAALGSGAFSDPQAREVPYADVEAAWEEYLQRDNGGRPVLLLGHSQGAQLLTRLLQRRIEPFVDRRDRLVSAMLLGGPVTVPVGEDVGGTFRFLPACRSRTQTGCVVAYATFGQTPPEPSLFARTGLPGQQVLCVNPAVPGGGAAPLDPVLPRSSDGSGTDVVGLASFPDGLVGECRTQDGAAWLDVSAPLGSAVPAEALLPRPTPAWGLHRLDVNVALDDLVALAADQAAALVGQG
jgi:hypothetical protein